MKNNDTEIKPESKLSYFGPIRRITAIYFLGFSIFMFVAIIMLIFLTKSSKEVKVPDVIGKRFISVYNSLVRIGLKPEIKFKDLFDKEDGIILKQHPAPGEIVEENNKITLVISRSNLLIDTPNLIGMDLPRAANKLKNQQLHGRSISLSAGVISYIQSDKHSDNIIIGQSPKADKKINPSVKINLLVSVGKLKDNTLMPQVIGQSIDLAYDFLAAKGIEIHENIITTSISTMNGIISSQSKNMNSPIRQGEPVTIGINWYPAKGHAYGDYEKFEFTIPQDQKDGLYEAYIEDNRSKRIRFSRNMKPGQLIQFIFYRTGNAKITIVHNKKSIWIKEISPDE